MVEFALTVVILIGLFLGIFDLGRAVYMNNGVAEAAREIARVSSVHPGVPLSSPTGETQAVIDAQQGIIHNLSEPTFTCVDIQGVLVPTPASRCVAGNWVKVEVTADYEPITPIFNLFPITLKSSSSIQIP